jgi:hypothetical protein
MPLLLYGYRAPGPFSSGYRADAVRPYKDRNLSREQVPLGHSTDYVRTV